jgi:hypothetical protein
MDSLDVMMPIAHKQDCVAHLPRSPSVAPAGQQPQRVQASWLTDQELELTAPGYVHASLDESAPLWK